MMRSALPRSLPSCVVAVIESQDSAYTAEKVPLESCQNGSPLPFQEGELFHLVFKSRKLLQTGNPAKPAYELMLEWPSDDKSRFFCPGEAIGILCPNDETEVEKTLHLLGLTGTEAVKISPVRDDAAEKRFERQFQYVPRMCSTRHLITHVLDLRTVLKRVFLKILGDCCPQDSTDRQKLHEMSSSAVYYKTHVLEDRLMIFDILEHFPLCKPNLSILIENLSRLGPRFYSVANYDSRQVKLLYRPITFVSRSRILLGQCSTYFDKIDDLNEAMGSLSMNDAENEPTRKATKPIYLKCYLRKNVRNFDFPSDNGTPFVFICHGTGVAPVEAYLDWLGKSDPDTTERWIFYGCRDISQDELLSVRKAEKLGFHLVVRQSRADPKRGYIQTAIPEHRGDLVRIVKECGGYVMICGDYNTMAAETLAALEMVLVDENNSEIVTDLMKQNRIKLDVWPS